MSRLGGVLAAVFILASVGNVRAECAAGECSADYFPATFTVDPPGPCFTDGQSVTLQCSGNLGGPPFNECSGGSWIYPSSTCEVFTCDPPASADAELSVSPVDDTYQARASITYSCTQGYTLTGATTAICDAQDVWNPNTVPVCIANCDPPTIGNGDLTSDGPFNVGDTAAAQCDEGYDMAPGSSTTITCLTGNEWSETPICYAECTVSGTSNSGTPDDVLISHMSSVTITCNDGYSYDQQTSFTVTCNDGGLEGTKPPSCYANCTAYEAPENGVVTGGNMHGQTVEFSCNRGYGTNDTTTDTCQDGIWDVNNTATCYALSAENSIRLFCNPDKFIVEIPGALLGNPEDLTKVKLGSCDADYYDGSYLYTNSSYNECGTTSEVDQLNRKVIYRNTVINIDSGLITTDSSVTIDVACAFDQDNLLSSTAIIQEAMSSSLAQGGQYAMVFAAYTDDTYATVITENDLVNADDTVYLRAELNYVNRADLFPTRCYATPQPSDIHHQYEDLISEGCPAVASNNYAYDLRTDTSTNQNFGFAMDVFSFSGSDSDSIYVHCEIKVCPIPPSEISACPLPGDSCPVARRRRATELTVTRHVLAGPIRINRLEQTDDLDDKERTALAVYSVTVSAVLLGVVAIVLLSFYRRRTRYKGVKRAEEE